MATKTHKKLKERFYAFCASKPQVLPTHHESIPTTRAEDVSRYERDLHVPTLQQVLKEFSDSRLVIEMKNAPAQFSPVGRLADLLTERNMTKQVLVASFHAPFREDFRRRLPQVATSLSLSVAGAAKITPAAVERILDKHLSRSGYEQGADALQLPHWVITRRIVEKVRERGLVIHAWTVDMPQSMDRMNELGVDGIITDCPSAVAGASWPRVVTRAGYFERRFDSRDTRPSASLGSCEHKHARSTWFQTRL